MATKESHEALGVGGILKKASRLSLRDDKILTTSLILFLPFMFLTICHPLQATLLRAVYQSVDADSLTSSANEIISRSVALFVAVVFLTIFHPAFVFDVIFTVHHTNDVYMRKSTGVMELLSRSATTWKKIMISVRSFLILFCYHALLFLIFFLLSARPKTAAGWRWVPYAFAWAIATSLADPIVHVSLDYVGCLLEVSDAENDKAVSDLMGGVKVRAQLALLVNLVIAPVCFLFCLHLRYHYHSEVLQYAMEFLLAMLFGACLRCIFVFFTVFYREKKP